MFQWGIAGVSVVPVLYLLGFLAWSVLAVRRGLGMLPLSSAQYLAAGLTLAIIVGLALLIEYMAWLLRKDRVPASKTPVTALVLSALSTAIALLLTGIFLTLIQRLLPFLDVRALNPMLVFVYMALLAMLCHLGSWLWLYYEFTSSKTDAAGERRPTNERTWSVTIISVVVFLAFSSLLLPAMNPEFGGARERQAYLDLDPADLSPETVSRLWPNWTSQPGEVQRTPAVRVLFSNDDTLLLRSMEEDTASGALFEIPRSAVKAIVWIR